MMRDFRPIKTIGFLSNGRPVFRGYVSWQTQHIESLLATEHADFARRNHRRIVDYVRARISLNHDSNGRDGIQDSLIRAERWHAVY